MTGTATSPPSIAITPVLIGDFRIAGMESLQNTQTRVNTGAAMKHTQHEAAVTFRE